MIIQRFSRDRGRILSAGVESLLTFSAGAYYDPAWMGFGALRALREVRAEPGAELAAHRYANTEVLSYVLEGAMGFAGDNGEGGVVRAGQIQWLGAGHGLSHRVYNAAPDAPLRFLQLWIQPDRLNARPAYALHEADPAQPTLASFEGREGGLPVRQDLSLRSLRLPAGATATHSLRAGRWLWLQVVGGNPQVQGRALAAGDALGFVGETGEVAISGSGEAELLLLDVPAAA